MFNDTLHFLANHLEAPDWRRLGEHLPFEWIKEAVQRTEATSIRHRRLPAEQVVWLMMALARLCRAVDQTTGFPPELQCTAQTGRTIPALSRC